MKTRNILLLFFFCAVNIFPAEAAAQNGLSLEQAIIRVLENHPKLRVEDYRAQALAARMRRVMLAPADRLNVHLEDFAGTGNAAGIRGMEATLSLSRTLELGNKASIRGDVVRREIFLLDNHKDIYRLDLLAETARRFIHITADQERLDMAEQAITLIRATEEAVEDRIIAGKTPDAERQRVVIDKTNLEVELDHRRHELENSRIRLATLWGKRQPDFEIVEGNIFVLAPIPEFRDLETLLERNPDLVRHVRAEDLARAQIRLARSQNRPNLDLSAGLRYLGESDDIAFMLQASIPLGTRSRARHDIEEAEALYQVEPLNLEQKRTELYAILHEIYQEMQHAMDAYESLVQKTIPAAQDMLFAYQEGFQAGRYSLLELIQVQQLLRNAHSQALEMAFNYHNYRIEIDRLTAVRIDQR